MGSQKNQTRKFGQWGEDLACLYLEQKGYTVIERNFTIRGGEIDIIAQKNDILVFVEVKLRTNHKFGSALESLTFFKKRSLLSAIHHYLWQHPKQYRQWRCDLIVLEKKSRWQVECRHLPNIFMT